MTTYNRACCAENLKIRIHHLDPRDLLTCRSTARPAKTKDSPNHHQRHDCPRDDGDGEGARSTG